MELGRHAAPLSPGSSADTGVSSSISDDMMEHDSDSLRDRLIALEKRVLDQNDEIVCLRSTVADVLRRVNQLENVRGAMTPPVAAMTPTKDVLRLRPSHYDTPDGRHSLNGGGVSNGSIHKDVLRRQPPTTSASALSNRRSVQYQSTGSLMSDSPSSTSASPAPSPSPTQSAQSQLRGSSTNLANLTASRRGTMPTIQATPSLSPAVHNVHFQAAKRWNSTSDFSSPHQPSSSSLANRRMTSSGSLLNLNAKLQPGMTARHGTRDATFNAEDGYVKFYLRGRPIVVHAPTSLVEDYSLTKVNMAPSSKLKLEWVYGYRGRDCRSNLYLLPTGEMVYFTAAVVVLYNVEEQLQRHYLGHTDDVKCLAVHPNKLLIATGQCAGHEKKDGRPHIRIWNSVSLATLHVIGIGDFEKSISCLAFSRADGGNLLVAVDEAPDHNLSVWDWQKGERGQKICETKCSSELVVAAEFHPMDRHILVTCGKSHICFWSLETGSLARKLGLFETRDKPKYVTCLAFSDRGDVLSGDSNGNILVWGRGTNTVLKALKNAHEGPVFSLLVLKDGTIVSGGGKDGQIVSWDPSYRRTGYVAEIPEQFGNVRTLAQGKGSQILVGTTRNCIVAGNFDLPFTPVVTGHTDEIWALCVHPNQSQFLSGGYDKLLHLWDTMSHSVIWSKEIGEPVQSATFSPDGSVIVVGTLSGRWLAMDAETKESYMSHTDGNEPLQVIKFSPDGTLLAIGSRDNNIYVYQVSEDGQKYNRIGKCTGHSSFITHLDWCTDNVHFRTNSGDYELLFWNAGICRQVPQASQLRDLEWATETCVVSFTTLGIWPEGADGTDVNSVEKSHDGKLLVTGDDFGKVRLYGYPASQPKSLCYSAVGHSSHVTQVSFLHDDSRVVSAGGKDSSLLQWTIV